MQAEDGFRLVMNQSLLAQVGGVRVDYLSGPLRRGFVVKAQSQGGADCSSGCSGC
ncbi:MULTISPECIES: hypothetical protein [Deferrisoma]